MADRINLFFFWFAGWASAALLAILLMVVTGGSGHSTSTSVGSLLAFILAIALPLFGCNYAGLTQSQSQIRILAASIVGWLFGMTLTATVSMGPYDWVNFPLFGHAWIIPCFFISGVLAICTIILDPNTKSAVDEKP